MDMTQFPDWPHLLQRIRQEIVALGNDERLWLQQRLSIIESLQQALDELFLKAGGVAACGQCDGACCDCGLHHLTLTNLLGYLLQNEEPPSPDFLQACPYLGTKGCLLSVSRRPYNCITFFCDRLEEQLDSGQTEQLRALDQQLRAEYERVAARHPGASLRGIWIASARLGDDPLLRQVAPDVVG